MSTAALQSGVASAASARYKLRRFLKQTDRALPRMKLRSPITIAVVATLAAIVLWVWLRTMRTAAATVDGRQHPTDPKREKYIFAFWHEGLLAPLAIKTPVRVLISEHADGELIAQVCRRMGIGVIRGSNTRGGLRALLEMIRTAGEPAHLGITPDGPRGPRRQLQAGTVMVASQTGIPILPIGVGFSRAWRAPSWDRFAVPCPFSTMVGVVGEPIVIPPDLSRDELKHFQSHVQARLLELTASAEEWAQRIVREGRGVAPLAPARPLDLRRAA
jgi:lysophospholipid acyltransferase (LPLAT)-like uncharacterized protein